jgi:hypothetical protein
LAEDSAPWAAHRLICVSEYADELDVGGFCTSDEPHQFKKDKEKYFAYHDNPLYYVDEYAKLPKYPIDDYDLDVR